MFDPRLRNRSSSRFDAPGWQRILTVGMALAIVFSLHTVVPAAAQAGSYEATANLNIRAEPVASASVVGGIPGGGKVEVTGPVENGYYPVSYNGIAGYASAEYLEPAGGSDEDGEEPAEPATVAGPTGTRYTEARLNLRIGPGASYGVIATMPAGAAVELTGDTANGFSEVTWNGNAGWAATGFLTTEGGQTQPTPPPAAPTSTTVTPTGAPTTPSAASAAIGDTPVGTAVVSTVGPSLNLRSGPGASFGVIGRLPSGAQVDVMGAVQGGFLPVRYQGTKGWASADFLRIGSGGTPVTPTATLPPSTLAPTATATTPVTNPPGGQIGNTVTGSASVTTIGLSLNLRSGPGSTFGVIGRLPSGAVVEVMGSAQNGFLPVRYGGTKGWASTAYLRVGSSGGTTPTATPVTPAPTTPPAPPTATATSPGGTSTGSGTVTAGRLNLRSGPGLSSSVVGVLTYGTRVEITGGAQNGFLPIRAQGTTGWAAQEFISPGPGGTPMPTATPVRPTATPVTPAPTATTRPVTPTPTATAPPVTPAPTIPPGGVSGTAVVSVTGTLNMRSGPGTTYPVLRGLANGSQVDLLGAAQNGFRPIRYQGTDGWASEAYLDIGATNPGDPGGSGDLEIPAIGNAAVGKATLNATVSLRRGPATSYGVVQTVTNGWRVEVMGNPVNGWTPIRYNAAKGWVPSGNLTSGWGYQIVDQMVTSRVVRLTAEPGGGALVELIPPGTLVDITGPAQGVYAPASWAGRRGWIDTSTLYQPESFVEPGPANASQAEMISLVYQAADKWGQNRADMLRVARCESNLDPRAVNSNGGASGLFQFMPSTFAFTPNGKRGEDIFNAWSNADAAGWMWANGMRHHWACQ